MLLVIFFSFSSSLYLYLLIGAFSPFTFKIIIDTSVFIAISSWLCFFSVSFSFCGLVISFYFMLLFFYFWFLNLLCSFDLLPYFISMLTPSCSFLGGSDSEESAGDMSSNPFLSYPGGTMVETPLPNAGDIGGMIFLTQEGRKWQPTPVFLPEKSHGQRSLVGYCTWVAKSRTQWSTSMQPLPITVWFRLIVI